MRLLLITPPVINANSPYPSTAYLKGYLKTLDRDAEQFDASLELFLRLFSRSGLNRIRDGIVKLQQDGYSPSWSVAEFLANFEHFHDTIETAIAVLQEKDPGSFPRAARRGYFPESLAPFASLELQYVTFHTLRNWLGKLNIPAEVSQGCPKDPLQLVFGTSSYVDRTRHLASCMILDVVRVISETLDPHLEWDRHAEALTAKAAGFADINRRLLATPSLIDTFIDEIARDLVARYQPQIVGLTVPFPGNFYGAIRIAKEMKARRAGLKTIMGGGFINAALRSPTDSLIFDYIDYIVLDDGPAPLQFLLEHLEGLRPENELLRTFLRRADGSVVFQSHSQAKDIPESDVGTPTFDGLPLESYLFDMQSHLRFNHVIGNRSNKLTLAHGCYWRKCAFCDTSLDYISRYEPVPLGITVDRIRAMIRHTGNSNFHFVDEAAPPGILKDLANELIGQGLAISWRANIRFEEIFCEIAPLLARSGCVALSGGIEAGCDRLLKLMNKGITLKRIARVCHAFSSAGILVHAYLLFGFPTQTAEETIDSLEFLRQLFAENALHSCAWHQFGLTRFSPIASCPDRFGVKVTRHRHAAFADYFWEYEEESSCDHNLFASGLVTAANNFMAGIGFDQDPREWFQPISMPAPSLPPNFVRQAIQADSSIS